MKFRLNCCWPSRAPGGGMCRCCSWPSWPPTESSWCRPPARTSWLASGKESQQLVWIIWGLWFGLGGNLSISSISKTASEFCHSKVVSLSCSFWNLLVYKTSGFHPGGGGGGGGGIPSKFWVCIYSIWVQCRNLKVTSHDFSFFILKKFIIDCPLPFIPNMLMLQLHTDVEHHTKLLSVSQHSTHFLYKYVRSIRLFTKLKHTCTHTHTHTHTHDLNSEAKYEQM